VAAALEAAEAGSLLDQLPPLARLRCEHRLDPPLRDHRPKTAAEPDVGEQLDEVEPAHRRAVDEVLAFAAAVQPPHDRHLREAELVAEPAVAVVEQELDLARVDRPRARRAAEEDVVGLLRAQLRRTHDAGRPEDRVRDVRLARAVRPDDDGDARLEPNFDRLREALEAAQLDRAQMHLQTVSAAADAVSRVTAP
jgi:hypothetical protein